jgi:hypothetical protein
MLTECECGESCPICEGCDYPLCECKCNDVSDFTDENEDDEEENSNW